VKADSVPDPGSACRRIAVRTSELQKLSRDATLLDHGSKPRSAAPPRVIGRVMNGTAGVCRTA
jgi:hypothetical protein